jgi:uncharacterized protein
MNTEIPAAALAQHVAVLGKTGSGKTTTAKLAVEQVVAAGARVCVLDPIKSDWWGMTSSADGRHDGLPFHILGGPRGHVPLHDAAGKAVAEVVAAGSLPLSIIDMADFRPGGQAKFFVDFAAALLRRMRGVLYLVMEEAHLFAPKERSGIGEENMAIHWSKMLATAGRSKGVRLIVLTQRTQSLHNALLGSCDSMIAHRMTAPADQEPVLKWLAANTDKATAARVAGSLSSLKTGEGWLCSGEAQVFERRQFPRIKTYDNTRTPTAEDGEHHVKTAPVDADQLKVIIGDGVRESEANDPRELRKRVAELERQLRERPAATVEVERVVEVPVLRNGQLDRTEKIAARLESFGDKLSTEGDRYRSEAAELRRLIGPAAQPRAVLSIPKSTPRSEKQGVPTTPRPAASIPSLTADMPPPGKCERSVLRVLAQHPDGCAAGKLALLAGYRFSGGFRNSLSNLRTAGLIAGGNHEVMRATDAGLATGPYEPLPAGAELVDYWLRHPSLGKCERAVLGELVRHPAGLTAEELCEATGYEFSGGFRNSLSVLRTAGLVLGGNRDRMRAAGELLGG